MLVFIHIEKCAGTTFKKILQHNYAGGFCDVRPLFGNANKEINLYVQNAYNNIVLDGGNPNQFLARDLKTYKQIAPWLKCIGGHSLRPCLGLEIVESEIQFVTILREPISRYISYYTYGSGKPRKLWKFSFDEYLEKPNFHNFQTKKIACGSDIEKAKLILSNQFMVVGVMEHFDEFLCVLKRRLAIPNFSIFYSSVNNRHTQIMDHWSKYEDKIYQNNSLDIELYNYVLNTIIPRQRAEYGKNLQDDVSQFKISNQSRDVGFSAKAFQQKLMQRFYFDFIAGIIRRMSGMHWGGPY
ncbi:sulfotransferase family 2 domain-containing protein [Thiocapsa imhoffii]|uniref:sulfotransferase family 2 domain-containing protein n=1 Tax=Thiocapsa imhoffii TaxID=382777 RepID=UPI001906A761|nr:sulfotransferase family 2 domain-containing protein [Thiocapsa imhoffii]